MYDAIVVGAGIIGLSTAYHIKKKNPNQKVLVIEKESAPGFGATGKCAGCFQGFFTSSTSTKLAGSSIRFYWTLQSRFGYNLKMRWLGFLWLLNEEQFKQVKGALSNMRGAEGEYELIDANKLAKQLKVRIKVSTAQDAAIIGLQDIYVGLLAKYAGTLDVDALLKFYEREFIKLGGEVKYDCKVDSIVIEPRNPLNINGEPLYWQEKEVTGVKVGAKTLRAKKTIIAAGGWMQQLLDEIGVDALIRPLKKSIFVIKANNEELKKVLHAKGFNNEGYMPFTIIPHPEVYIKPEVDEESFWIGHGLTFGMPFKIEEEYLPDMKLYERGIYPILTSYFPQFKDARPINAWSSIYEVTTVDRQPIIFEENNLIAVGGGSGYGLMKADAIGRIAAAVYYEEEWAQLFGNVKFKCADLSIKCRKVEPELFTL
ncbi:MAG: hypothetical protein DRJ18_02945 [Candidatus Methanomethylicota archaeon]|nr:FAD-binding oxidoreductase [Candidatus Culexmicrobium cathedralense]RLE47692.1 MAG: hypothetical protein DRJ18_02945 [Candidatus Verstraetearchaeota archaeon]